MNPFDPNYRPQMPAPTPSEQGRRTAAKKLAKRNRDACAIKIRRDVVPTAEQKQAGRATTAKILKSGAL